MSRFPPRRRVPLAAGPRGKAADPPFDLIDRFVERGRPGGQPDGVCSLEPFGSHVRIGFDVMHARAASFRAVENGLALVRPAEAGQWLIDASVDFTKGCFTGQELVARIDSRGGNVPRHLRALVAPDGVLEPGATLVADGQEVGAVTSVAPHPAGGTVALAYVGRAVTPPAPLDVRAAGGTLAVTALATPLPD